MSVDPAHAAELRRGLAAAVSLLVLWTAFNLVSRFGLKGQLAADDLAALRFAVAGVALGPLLLRHGLFGLTPKQAALLSASGGLAWTLLAYTGFMLAPANHGGGLMPGALPLFAAAIAWASGTERVSRRQLGGMLVIALGIALLLGESILAATPRQLLGDVCFLGGSAAWAAYAVLIRRWHVPPLGAVVLPNVLTGLVFLPLYFLLLDPRLHQLPATTLLIQGGYHGLVATVVSTGLFAYAVRRLGPARTTLITAFTPVLVALAAMPLLDERPTALGAAGLAAVTCGILIGVGRAWRPR